MTLSNPLLVFSLITLCFPWLSNLMMLLVLSDTVLSLLLMYSITLGMFSLAMYRVVIPRKSLVQKTNFRSELVVTSTISPSCTYISCSFEQHVIWSGVQSQAGLPSLVWPVQKSLETLSVSAPGFNTWRLRVTSPCRVLRTRLNNACPERNSIYDITPLLVFFASFFLRVCTRPPSVPRKTTRSLMKTGIKTPKNIVAYCVQLILA